MIPAELEKTARKIFGHRYWKAQLARALAIDVSTIHRMMKRPEIPGPVEVAIKGLLQHKKAQDIVEREARKLLPRKLRKRKTPRKPKKVVPPLNKPLDTTTS